MSKILLATIAIAVVLNLIIPQMVLLFMKPSKNKLQNEVLAMMKHHDEVKFSSSVIVALIVAISVVLAKRIV